MRCTRSAGCRAGAGKQRPCMHAVDVTCGRQPVRSPVLVTRLYCIAVCDRLLRQRNCTAGCRTALQAAACCRLAERRRLLLQALRLEQRARVSAHNLQASGSCGQARSLPAAAGQSMLGRRRGSTAGGEGRAGERPRRLTLLKLSPGRRLQALTHCAPRHSPASFGTAGAARGRAGAGSSRFETPALLVWTFSSSHCSLLPPCITHKRA